MKLTARELKLFRLALDKGASPQEAAAAAKAFVESMRARGASSYEAVPESGSRPRPEPPPQPSSPPPPPPQPEPPPKYEPKPPPPREETPPWWTRAKDQPPPPPRPKAEPKWEPWREDWTPPEEEPDRNPLLALLCFIGLLLSLLALGYYTNQAAAEKQKPFTEALERMATPSPSPSSSPAYYIGGSYLVYIPDQKNQKPGVGTIRGIVKHIFQLPDDPKPWDLYYCQATGDYWVSFPNGAKLKWVEHPTLVQFAHP